MKKGMFVLLLILIKITSVSAQGIDGIIDYANNLTTIYQATADALNVSSSKTDIMIQRDKKNQKEPIMYEGVGQDTLEIDHYSVNDYPFLYIHHPSRFGSFYMYGSEKYSSSGVNYIYHSNSDTYSVIPLFGGFITDVSYIEAKNINGKWQVAFLPPKTSMVPEYKTPATIQGDQSSVIFIKNPGDIAEIRFESKGLNALKQIFPNGYSNLLVSEAVPYSGKVKIKNQESYFAIETSGRWIISFKGSSNNEPEVSFLDNKSNFKSISAKEITVEDNSLEFSEKEIEIQNGVLGKWYDCGEDFRFMIYYQPIMTKSQSYQVAEGMFILFRAKIANISNETMNGLEPDSFTLSRMYNNTEVKFTLSDINSYSTSKRWEINTLSDKIAPFSELDTYLVFDVNGNPTDNWTLSFAPKIAGTNYQICNIKMTLPKISY